jgi:hypothetical protein
LWLLWLANADNARRQDSPAPVIFNALAAVVAAGALPHRLSTGQELRCHG